MNWQIDVIHIEEIDNLVISLVHVKTEDDPNVPSFCATSFFEFENEKIQSLIENWGENGLPPQWRTKMKISSPIMK